MHLKLLKHALNIYLSQSTFMYELFTNIIDELYAARLGGMKTAYESIVGCRPTDLHTCTTVYNLLRPLFNLSYSTYLHTFGFILIQAYLTVNIWQDDDGLHLSEHVRMYLYMYDNIHLPRCDINSIQYKYNINHWTVKYSSPLQVQREIHLP